VQREQAYYGALALQTPIVLDEGVAIADTNGARVRLNPTRFLALGDRERAGLLLHEVLHVALLHVPRRGERDRQRWNIAADLVVNAIVLELGYLLPRGGVYHPKYAGWDAESVYGALETPPPNLPLALPDDRSDLGDPPPEQDAAATERRWLAAHALAAQHPRANAEHARRHQLHAGPRASVDWRERLWRTLTDARDDYDGFDPRLVHAGVYLDALDRPSVDVCVVVDTSASCLGAWPAFVSELRAIARAHPNVRGLVTFGDHDPDGPHPLAGPFPSVRAGGGTDLARVQAHALAKHAGTPDLLVHLTDGLDEIPAPSGVATVWVVSPFGAPDAAFAHGTVVRLPVAGR
jgi:predicted metal-dependent peptidase